MIQENKKKLKKLEVMHLEKMKFQEVCFESPFCWLQYSENCATILCMYWSQSCSNVKMRSSLELYWAWPISDVFSFMVMLVKFVLAY